MKVTEKTTIILESKEEKETLKDILCKYTCIEHKCDSNKEYFDLANDLYYTLQGE